VPPQPSQQEYTTLNLTAPLDTTKNPTTGGGSKGQIITQIVLPPEASLPIPQDYNIQFKIRYYDLNDLTQFNDAVFAYLIVDKQSDVPKIWVTPTAPSIIMSTSSTSKPTTTTTATTTPNADNNDSQVDLRTRTIYTFVTVGILAAAILITLIIFLIHRYGEHGLSWLPQSLRKRRKGTDEEISAEKQAALDAEMEMRVATNVRRQVLETVAVMRLQQQQQQQRELEAGATGLVAGTGNIKIEVADVKDNKNDLKTITEDVEPIPRTSMSPSVQSGNSSTLNNNNNVTTTTTTNSSSVPPSPQTRKPRVSFSPDAIDKQQLAEEINSTTKKDQQQSDPILNNALTAVALDYRAFMTSPVNNPSTPNTTTSPTTTTPSQPPAAASSSKRSNNIILSPTPSTSIRSIPVPIPTNMTSPDGFLKSEVWGDVVDSDDDGQGNGKVMVAVLKSNEVEPPKGLFVGGDDGEETDDEWRK
ncbi:hypothetical protein HDU76_000349, partial [Blyttiomyces sp. JEL0837]